MPIDSLHRTAGNARPPSGACAERLKFDGDNGFQRELRRRVEDHFRLTGQRPRDNARMYLKTAAILAGFAAAYVLLVFVAGTWWQGLPLAVVLGILMAQIGFNIQHDAGHQAYSEHRRVNQWMAMTLDLVGGSSYLWHRKHVHFHHTYVNIDGHDSDISLGALARFSPQQRRLRHHRWQHLYLWVLYGFTVVSWHLHDDFRDLAIARIGTQPIQRPRGKDLAVFVLGKLVFFGLAFGLPLMRHPLGTVLLFYLVTAMVAGLLLALVFQLAHAVEEAAFPAPGASGRMDQPWAVHQLETTVDFARGSRAITWLVGGLNFQVEHHLFPRICHVHYPAISGVIETACREYGMPYHANRSFGAGIASHYRWLRRMGQPDAVPLPVLKPVPQA